MSCLLGILEGDVANRFLPWAAASLTVVFVGGARQGPAGLSVAVVPNGFCMVSGNPGEPSEHEECVGRPQPFAAAAVEGLRANPPRDDVMRCSNRPR